MVQQHRNLYQIDSFEVYGAKVRGYKHYVNLSLQEVKEIIKVLLSGLVQGKVEGFTVTVYEEELEQYDRRGEKKRAQIVV
jgi:small nuclear ribonucleoprotein (snRNP)-like protein